MTKKLAMTLAIALFAGSVQLFAEPLEQDDIEVILKGWVDFKTPGGKTGYDIDLGVGYFIADDWEVGPSLKLICDGSDSGWGMGGFTEYNFYFDMPLVPYVGGHLHFITGDYFNESAFMLTAAFGAKYFLSEKFALGAAFHYLYATEDAFNDDGERQNTDYRLVLDVRAFF